MTCANNCKGVDPNGVVIGGTALLAAATLTGQQMLVVSAGVAALSGTPVVANGMANVISQMFNRGCPRTRPCKVGCYLSVSTLSDPLLLPRDGVEGTPVAESAANPLGEPTATDLSVQGDVEKRERLEYMSVLLYNC